MMVKARSKGSTSMDSVEHAADQEDEHGVASTSDHAPDEPIHHLKIGNLTMQLLNYFDGEGNEWRSIRSGRRPPYKFMQSQYLLKNFPVFADDGRPYDPTHVKNELFRYFLVGRKQRRDISPLVMAACAHAFVHSPEALDLYPDFPGLPTICATAKQFSMFYNDRLNELREKTPGIKFAFSEATEVRKNCRSEMKNDEIRQKYEKKYAKHARRHKRKLDAFLDAHPELEFFRLLWEKRQMKSLQLEFRAGKRKQGVDIYREQKAQAKKYASLEGEKLDAKLKRHFDKLSDERRKPYEDQAKQWNLKNCPRVLTALLDDPDEHAGVGVVANEYRDYAPNLDIPPLLMGRFTMKFLTTCADEWEGIGRCERSLYDVGARQFRWGGAMLGVSLKNPDGLFYRFAHLKKELKRYYSRATRIARSKMSAASVVAVVHDYVHSGTCLPILYPGDCPEPPPDELMYYYNRHKRKLQEERKLFEMKGQERTLNNIDIHNQLRKQWTTDREVQERNRKKWNKKMAKYKNTMDEFFGRHPELEIFRRIGIKDPPLQRSLIGRKTAFKAKSPLDIYREDKRSSKRYAGLSDFDFEAKLFRHFKKLSKEKRREYKQKAAKWRGHVYSQSDLAKHELFENFPETNDVAENGPSRDADAHDQTDREQKKNKKKRKLVENHLATEESSPEIQVKAKKRKRKHRDSNED